MSASLFEERKVTNTLEVGDRIIVVENVPARVNVETGERLFSPDTVERFQQLVWNERKTSRVMEVPVYEFA